ncbi:Pr6Pr family membrane protein [Parapedobacter sp. 2B3]|uniref:Pr6Pr family membrane protein n=1 Tax=Parapedobacter sp. 2B3 TaxID=3342381 RepID=UPI0035B5A942
MAPVNHNHRTQLPMAIVGALLAWIAVILQFVLMLQNRAFPIPETLVRFFSYYTILTNLLVACCFTALACKPVEAKPRFLADPRMLAATAVYITVVGAVYNIILRHQWAPQGLQLVVDELLHSVTPLYYLVFWVAFIPKTMLTWKHVFPWLLYPLIYFLCILVRGALSGFYPYPFINVTELGWGTVLLNSAGITVAFVVVSLVVIGISRFKRL